MNYNVDTLLEILISMKEKKMKKKESAFTDVESIIKRNKLAIKKENKKKGKKPKEKREKKQFHLS